MIIEKSLRVLYVKFYTNSRGDRQQFLRAVLLKISPFNWPDKASGLMSSLLPDDFIHFALQLLRLDKSILTMLLRLEYFTIRHLQPSQFHFLSHIAAKVYRKCIYVHIRKKKLVGLTRIQNLQDMRNSICERSNQIFFSRSYFLMTW